MRVTRSTLLEIFRRSSKKDLALQNPYEFAHVAVHYVKLRLADQLVDGIQYEKINEWYEMTQFEFEFVDWQEYLVPSEKADGSAGASLYDYVFVESGPERLFVEGLERDDRVKLYFKLPAWFKVDTPIGPYNPDWAIVFEERDEFGKPKEVLYLVRETKDTTDLGKLRPDEKRKIMCGEKHFEGALGVNYKVVKDVGGLLP
jgi:type III restriction enzyme